MKAIVFEKTKNKKELIYKDVIVPKPKPNEVLVKIHAVSLNAADYRSYQMGLIPGWHPDEFFDNFINCIKYLNKSMQT